MEIQNGNMMGIRLNPEWEHDGNTTNTIMEIYLEGWELQFRIMGIK